MAEHLHGYPLCEARAGQPCSESDLNYEECKSYGALQSCSPSVVDGMPTGLYRCTHRDAMAAPRPKAVTKKMAAKKPKPAKKAARKVAKAKPKKAARKVAKAKPKKAARKAKPAKKASGRKAGKKKKK